MVNGRRNCAVCAGAGRQHAADARAHVSGVRTRMDRGEGERGTAGRGELLTDQGTQVPQLDRGHVAKDAVDNASAKAASRPKNETQVAKLGQQLIPAGKPAATVHARGRHATVAETVSPSACADRRRQAGRGSARPGRGGGGKQEGRVSVRRLSQVGQKALDFEQRVPKRARSVPGQGGLGVLVRVLP